MMIWVEMTISQMEAATLAQKAVSPATRRLMASGNVRWPNLSGRKLFKC